jgi:hypothetical protein
MSSCLTSNQSEPFYDNHANAKALSALGTEVLLKGKGAAGVLGRTNAITLDKSRMSL